MPKGLTSRLRTVAIWALAALPWLASMYGFYWLDASGTWTADTPHRGKLSVMLLGSGMLLSFLLHARLTRSAAGK